MVLQFNFHRQDYPTEIETARKIFILTTVSIGAKKKFHLNQYHRKDPKSLEAVQGYICN